MDRFVIDRQLWIGVTITVERIEYGTVKSTKYIRSVMGNSQ